ncbi:hypothetical protein [Streptomyces sp. NPDC051921]|uniref:hypothetical protein n=1 Tax=Streptomyces sp. NPDC051921 TaxID=3155806 RepID=UPI00342E32CA
MRDSHVGGPMLWPYGEPWPVCHEPHQPETEGYAPDEIRKARAAGVWPRSRPWTGAGAPGADGPVPFVGLAQFFRRDVPGLAAGPDGADLVQLFRCPFTRSHSWMPLEDRDPPQRGKASILGGPSVARPMRLRFGQDRDLHVFTCPADPAHPPRWVLS